MEMSDLYERIRVFFAPEDVHTTDLAGCAKKGSGARAVFFYVWHQDTSKMLLVEKTQFYLAHAPLRDC